MKTRIAGVTSSHWLIVFPMIILIGGLTASRWGLNPPQALALTPSTTTPPVTQVVTFTFPATMPVGKESSGTSSNSAPATASNREDLVELDHVCRTVPDFAARAYPIGSATSDLVVIDKTKYGYRVLLFVSPRRTTKVFIETLKAVAKVGLCLS